MNIAYIIDIGCCVSPFNGIRVQAQTWADELKIKGNSVTLINPWNKVDWKSFDVIHIFGQNENLLGWTQSLSQYNIPIVVSPIIDTIQSVRMYKLVAKLNIPFLRMSTVNNKVSRADKYVSKWLARSEFEATYINKSYGIAKDKIKIVPLSYRIPTIDYYPEKKPYCLHVSIITDERKNVMRLMQAAIKYKFNLVLAGSNKEEDFPTFKKIIESNDNITYLGRVSDEKLIELYKEAKVFALPSITEGVGMVAVEAAAYGCDIVVTKLGGPKEYYGNNAFIINPYDVDEIGASVIRALTETNKQPLLMNQIIEKYNLSSCVDELKEVYRGK